MSDLIVPASILRKPNYQETLEAIRKGQWRTHPLGRGLASFVVLGGVGLLLPNDLISGASLTWVGTRARSLTTGPLGPAIALASGSDSYWSTSNPAWQHADGITVEIRARLDSTGYAALAHNNGGSQGWEVEYTGSGWTFTVWTTALNTVVSPVSTAGATGQWYTVVGTWQSAVGPSVFVNGRGYGTTANVDTQIRTGSNPSYFGSDGGGDPFTGALSYVRVWNRPLSTTEIAWLYRGPFTMLRQRVPYFVIPSVSSGGTSYPKSFAGTLTPSGILARQTDKPLMGSLTSVGTFKPLITRNLTATLATSGSLIKRSARGLGSQIAPAGALVKRISHLFDGSVTPSGTVTTAKAILLAISGSLAPMGSLSRQVHPTYAGTLASSGATVKQVRHTLTGALAPAGSLNRLISKVLAGVLALAGALTNTRPAATQRGTISLAVSMATITLTEASATISLAVED